MFNTEYTPQVLSAPSAIMQADSYKFSHGPVYPEGTDGLFSYVEPRKKGHTLVPVGLQAWLMKTLSKRITADNIAEAEAFALQHGEPFDAGMWKYIVTDCDGYLPLKIRAVPEGLPIPSGNILASVEAYNSPSGIKLFSLASRVETALQRAIWYPTTVASRDREFYFMLKDMYLKTGAPLEALAFALHDFGGRGVTCSEQAEIGGLAHLVHFMGSDTVEGVRYANHYYDDHMSAFSVPATEHSVQCSFGPDNQSGYLKHVLETYATSSSAIVSIVIDGYDVYREANLLCTEFKDMILASGAKVVFRPDSGDMEQVVPTILDMQARAFGVEENPNGFAKIKTVGLLQGDGVDLLSARCLLNKMATKKYRADNIVFGSGGALLQKMDRDTYSFSQKATAIRVNGVWKDIYKDPITDPGKKSKTGRLSLARSKMTPSFFTTYNLANPLDSEFEDVMQTVYDCGKFYNRTTLKEVRQRAGALV